MGLKRRHGAFLTIIFGVGFLIVLVTSVFIYDQRPQTPDDLLADKIREQIQSIKEAGHATKIAFYMSDLTTHTSIRVHSDRRFIGASLMKVPIVMGYLKRAETNPELLTRKLTYDPDRDNIPNLYQTIDPPEPLIPGKEYTIDELIHKILIDSDNVSLAILMNSLPDLDAIDELHKMGIAAEIENGDSSVYVQDYAQIFRLLYEGSYLDKKTSEYILDLLDEADYTGGMQSAAGDLRIAQKFGERRYGDLQQFHDCGIVYYPNKPFILCIMTKGSNNADLIQAVYDLTKTVLIDLRARELH